MSQRLSSESIVTKSSHLMPTVLYRSIRLGEAHSSLGFPGTPGWPQSPTQHHLWTEPSSKLSQISQGPWKQPTANIRVNIHGK